MSSWGGDLVRALERVDYDLVIPVGARSVSTVANAFPERAILPSRAAIDVCFDKLKDGRASFEPPCATPAHLGSAEP